MNKFIMITALLAATTLAGCASGPNQAVGTGAGALGGYAVGKALGGDAAGRAVGAVAGAMIGSSVGQSMDQQQQHQQQQRPIIIQQSPPIVYRERVVTCFYVREWDGYYRAYVDRKVCR